MRIRTAFVVVIILLGLMWAFAPQQPARAECGVYHTVLAGQNLFRISLRYGVSMNAIASANNIADVRRIYAGQKLYIPCSGGTTPGTTTGTTTTTTTTTTTVTTVTTIVVTTTPVAPGTTGVNCTGFRATSPLDGLTSGDNTFYWDPPKSGTVTSYQVYVLNDKGQLVAGFTAPGGITRTRGNMSVSAVGRGINFSWYVVALNNGQEICRTQTVTLRREWSNEMGS